MINYLNIELDPSDVLDIRERRETAKFKLAKEILLAESSDYLTLKHRDYDYTYDHVSVKGNFSIKEVKGSFKLLQVNILLSEFRVSLNGKHYNYDLTQDLDKRHFTLKRISDYIKTHMDAEIYFSGTHFQCKLISKGYQDLELEKLINDLSECRYQDALLESVRILEKR